MTFAVRTVRDIAYGADPAQSFDLYLPETHSPPPVVVHLHGGAWRVGDKADTPTQRLRGVAAHGVAVVSANYRLLPQFRYPAPVDDVRHVVAWLREHGEEHGLATARVGAWGASAGAYLAMMAALTPPDASSWPLRLDPSSSSIEAVVSWFGPTDLVSGSRRSRLEDELLPPRGERDFLGEELDTPDGLALASPITWVSPDAPPFLIAHGDRDRIVPPAESAAMHDRLVRAGASSTHVVLGGAGHEDVAFDSPSHLAHTAAFLTQHLTTTTAPVEGP